MNDERDVGGGGGSVATLLIEGRQKSGLSQVQLAEKAGVSRSRIIAAEARTSQPTLDLALRLSRALGIPVDAMVRSHVHDALNGTDPAIKQEIDAALAGTGAHWEAIAAHAGLRIEHGVYAATINDTGDMRIVRRFTGCHATRSRSRLVFRDRIVGEKPPAFAIKGSPRGLGYGIDVAVEGEWALHRVEFRQPWRPEDGPFDFEFETTLPRAYVLDRESFDRRRAAEGLPAQRSWRGSVRAAVSHAIERHDLTIALPKSYRPRWGKPTAVWGNAPMDDVDYDELHPRTCRAVSLQAEGNRALLTIERPVPGFTFGIHWTPIEGWRPERKGERS